MTLKQLLDQLLMVDIKLSLAGDQLRVNAPKGALTSELKAALTRFKPDLVKRLQQQSDQHQEIPLVAVARHEPLPLSFSQQRLWAISQLVTNPAAHNVTQAIRIYGSLDVSRLQLSLQQIINRHESLRTQFLVLEGKPVQIIQPPQPLDLPIEYIAETDVDDHLIVQTAERLTQHTFTLDQGLLFQFHLLGLSQTDHCLFLTVHHLVFDVLSLYPFLNELTQLYAAYRQGSKTSLADLPIQYGDFTVWQQQWLQAERLQQGLDYWQQQLEGVNQALTLPTDYPRPKIPALQGDQIAFYVSAQRWSQLKQLSNDHQVTPFVTLLTAFKVLLYQCSGQTDLVVGIPVSGRIHQQLEPLIGCFADTILLRTDCSANPTFATLLAQVKQTTLAGQANQHIPLGKVFETLKMQRTKQYQSWFQVLFDFLGRQKNNMTTDTLRFELVKEASKTPTDLDLFMLLFELTDEQGAPSGLEGMLEYNREIFAATTIQALIDAYQHILMQCVTTPDLPLHQFKLSGQLLDRWTDVQAKQQQLAQVEAALLSAPGIDDGIVLQRDGVLVAYPVPTSRFTLAPLQRHLQSQLPTELQPKYIVPITTLPLTTQGQLNQGVLMGCPVLDQTQIEVWQQQLQAMAGSDQVTLSIQQPMPNVSVLHRDALLDVGQSVVPSVVTSDLSQPASTTLAWVQAETLQDQTHFPLKLADILLVAAEQTPEHVITYIQTGGQVVTQTYAQLRDDALGVMAGLQAQGLKPAAKVILLLTDNRDLLTAFWGCLCGGFIPVIMPVPATEAQTDQKVEKLLGVWQLLAKPLLVTAADHIERLQRLFQAQSDNWQCVALADLQQPATGQSPYQAQPNEVAFLSLTSGSTGTPKCIELTQRNLIARLRGANQLCQQSREDVILSWLPFDHIGSISDWHLRYLDLGCRLIYVQTDYILGRILNWLDLIDQYQVNHSWAPNFAYNLMIAALQQQPQQAVDNMWHLKCLKSWLTSGEAVSQQTITTLTTYLQHYGLRDTVFMPAFGMAETGSGITYHRATTAHPVRFHLLDKSSLSGRLQWVDPDHPQAMAFTDLGCAIPGVSLRIVDEQYQVLPESTVGRLQVQGEAVFKGYYQDQAANQAALVDGWFNTGDLGFIAHGHLVLTGRAKDTIILNGVNYYSQEIEAVVATVEQVEVTYIAACAVPLPAQDKEGLALFFSTSVHGSSALKLLLQQIRARLAAQFQIQADYLIAVDKVQIPKTSIGKIQRSVLRQRFIAGEFDAIVHEIDVLLENEHTLPNWFYQPIWRRKKLLHHNDAVINQTLLVFCDDVGLGDWLFEHNPMHTIKVTSSDCFKQWDQYHYALRPDNVDDYAQLMATLTQHGFNLDCILHLWNYTASSAEITSLSGLDTAQTHGLYSVLALLKSLPQQTTHIKLCYVTSYAQQVDANEVIAYEKSPALGLLKSIQQEMPWLRCCHIDLPLTSVADCGASLLREIQATTPDTDIAYRNQQRYVAGLQQFEPDLKSQPKAILKSQGVYLISGGLGGIGFEIARFLLSQYQAQLILIGRTMLDSPPAAMDQSIKDKYQSLQTLQRIGSVVYLALDVCDEKQVQLQVTQALSTWDCELDGIIHLAGDYHEQLLVAENPTTIQQICRTKIQGTWVLQRLIADQPHAFFSHFGSIAGFFGGIKMGAYAAANRFVMQFAMAKGQQNPRHGFCFSWSQWDNIGMSQGYQREAMIKQAGFYPINVSQGIQSWQLGLSQPTASWLIGLDGRRQNIRRFTTDFAPLQQLVGHTSSALPTDQWQDVFGLDIPVQWMTATGNDNDETAFVVAEIDHIAQPRNEIEAKLATLWKNQLGLNTVGMRDNYFELGGTSILAVQLIYQTQAEFQIELPVNLLLTEPTIEKIAEIIKQIGQGVDPFDLSEHLTVDNKQTQAIAADVAAANIEAEVEQLSDDELAAAIAAELAEIDKL